MASPRRQPEDWICAIADVCEGAARGDLERRLLHNDAGGELRRAVNAVNALLDVVDAFVREARVSLDSATNDQFHRRILLGGLDGCYAQAAHALNGAVDRMEQRHGSLRQAQQDRQDLADDFEGDVGQVVVAVASAATELTSTADNLERTAEATLRRAQATQEGARRAAQEVTLATEATDSVSSAAQGIGQSASDGCSDAAQARRVVEDGKRTIDGLATAMSSISDSVSAIRAIARQTNLLALNASIEAARAGAAGRGFGVVANEVKDLARQTAGATRSIEEVVRGLREGADAVKASFDAVEQTVGTLASRSDSIYAAAQQQLEEAGLLHATLEAIAASTRDAARHTEEVVEDTSHTAAAVHQMGQAAEDLSVRAEQLRSHVDAFLHRVRQDEISLASSGDVVAA